MNFKFSIYADPSDAPNCIEMDRIQKRVDSIADEKGFSMCAAFGQIQFYKEGPPDLRGRIFTGEAMHYLAKHLKIAIEMQTEDEKDQ